MNISHFFSDKKILIIDDCRMIFTATRVMLVNHGCKAENIIQSIDAKNSIEICEKQQFDFILCDYNLGKGTDGLQLLEILHQKKLIAAKTVIFIVTAESKKSVFYGFSEYQPDGYLIKPVKIHQVAGKLFNAFIVKENLQKIEDLYQREGVESAIKHALSYPQTKSIRLKEAEIYARANYYQQAKETYLALIKENDNKAKIGLAELLLTQQQYDLTLKFIESLITIPEIKIQALQLKANCYLLTQKMHLALQAFSEASELSPHNIERLLTMFNISEIIADNESRLMIANKISHRVINSHWESFATLSYRLRALLRQPYSELQQRTTQSLIHQERRKLEKRYASSVHRLQRQSFRAQILLSMGDVKGCYASLAEIERIEAEQNNFSPVTAENPAENTDEHTTQNDAENVAVDVPNNAAANKAESRQTERQQSEQQALDKDPNNIIFDLDMVHLYIALGQFKNALQRIKKLQTIAITNNSLAITQSFLFQHLSQKIKRKKNDLITLIEKAEHAKTAGQDLQATNYLLDAWVAQPFSIELALTLLSALTKAIPMGKDIETLSINLKQIRHTLEVDNNKEHIPDWAPLALKQVEHSLSELQHRKKT